MPNETKIILNVPMESMYVSGNKIYTKDALINAFRKVDNLPLVFDNDGETIRVGTIVSMKYIEEGRLIGNVFKNVSECRVEVIVYIDIIDKLKVSYYLPDVVSNCVRTLI